MNYSLVIHILGYVLVTEGGLFLLPMTAAVIYGERAWYVWLLFALATALTGFLMTRVKMKNGRLVQRDGNIAVALSWLVMSFIGALPFVVLGDIPNYLDALFETVSGFTTTGASILPAVEGLNHSSLFWRSLTHWVGGMGVFILIMSFLPLTGSSTIHLMRAESPGYSVDRMVPRLRDTAKKLYTIYLIITAAEIVCLILSGMKVFDSFCLTFGTVGTGGFGVRNDSLASYTPLQQYIVTLFMILSGVNYAAYFALAAKRPKDALKNQEVRMYLLIFAATSAVITANLMGLFAPDGARHTGFFEALRHAMFQTGSIMTTTGFTTADYDLWPGLSKSLLLALMIIGACAGSTGGGFKISRLMIVLKEIKREILLIFHPNSVQNVRMEGHQLSRDTIRTMNVFTLAYCVIFAVSVILISVDNFDMTTNITAVAATFNNIGPGLAAVGPVRNYAAFSGFSKVILIFDMLCGRLELFPMLTILVPAAWKKR